MERLFSPWRSKYIETIARKTGGEQECVLCEAHKDKNDESHLILSRGERCYVIMNLFPYNSGHIMVVPYRHVPDLTDENELHEIMNHLKQTMQALRSVSRPEGFNIGSNIGKIAGAGIDQHVHFHLVPRWSGDTNFMPVLSDTKLISDDMHETWRKLHAWLKNPPPLT